MPADHEQDRIDRWLAEQVRPLPPPPGTFELITRRARRRKIRRAVVSAASAAAVAAAVAVAVPAGLSLHLVPATHGSLAGNASEPAYGSSAPGRQGTASAAAGPLAPTTADPAGSASPAASGTAGGGLSSPGALPAGFTPSSVTWVSLSTGWVLGQAGTPGKCANANPDICTSIARTSDGGRTWQGLPAPDTGGPQAASGVTGLRFLNATDGWAYGPELWATDDGGQHWHQVSTGGASVTDLETASGRAYALFGTCSATGDVIADCTSYTLETAVAGSDAWTAVSGIPAGLTAATGGAASAQLVQAAAAGYLVAPDGTLYAGPLDGTAWHRVAALPCTPGSAASSGLPGNVMLAAAGASASGAGRLALACAQPASSTAGGSSPSGTAVYWSQDGGATWAEDTGVGNGGTAQVGLPTSLAATSDGTLILATEAAPAVTGAAAVSGGLYVLPLGAAAWTAASVADAAAAGGGFSYVGMTSATQGVALSAGGSPHAIWMTGDGGQTWSVRPIAS